ncbi:GSCFA domain-containing protein [Nitratireductor sp. ZSWI3]|uniref:GSCFA domain-containing protein n=1 Tax=Nitratireductor sp. ZSWI3 TaxID=2966359 RepID=UPI00214F86AF|nr:GSCFA domain-containing protein [Nitratireductor sp. ZSWI3]MCR4269091.1 GSCFA domain-containing protein [Nitratireductor sp. ZSWI3]
MPDNIEISAEEALNNYRNNPAKNWNGAGSAKSRFDSGERMSVNIVPKFKLDKTAQVYTIGSCFAREIERTLINEDIPLLTEGYGLPPERFDSWNPETGVGGGVRVGHISRGCFNKYTTHSMNIDVQRALEGYQLPDDGLIEFEEGVWFDPHAAGLKVGDIDTVRADRKILDEASSKIAKADVVFVTLGMTESWIHQPTLIPMNRAPGKYLHKRKDIFRFADYGYVAVMDQVVQMLDAIHKVRPKLKVIMTVSPVPHSTFLPHDVLSTVTGAKSTLRAVAGDLARRIDFVDYFPSYEMVINSPRGLTWLDDGVHVQPGMVRHVTKTFVEAYYG